MKSSALRVTATAEFRCTPMRCAAALNSTPRSSPTSPPCMPPCDEKPGAKASPGRSSIYLKTTAIPAFNPPSGHPQDSCRPKAPEAAAVSAHEAIGASIKDERADHVFLKLNRAYLRCPGMTG